MTLALRTGGKKVFGTYPYMEAASIGEGGLGAGRLPSPRTRCGKGYRARRYMGDSSAWANAEIRLRISRITLILPGIWGINAFRRHRPRLARGVERHLVHGRGRGSLAVIAERPHGLLHRDLPRQRGNLFYVKGGFGY
jgi:hypothetical protein